MEEGKKFDNDKLRLDLIPPIVEEALAEVLTHGAKKYGDDNWKNGIKYSRVYGAVRRHLLSWLKGEMCDQESNMPHLWHALCELAFLIYYEEHPEKYMKFQDLFGVKEDEN